MRRKLLVMAIIAATISLCVAGVASGATRYYTADEDSGFLALDSTVRIKNKEPRMVEAISYQFSSVDCGFSTFYSGGFHDLPVRNDRFNGAEGDASITGKFSGTARRINVTITIAGEDPCQVEGVLKKTNECPYPVCFDRAAAGEAIRLP